MFGTLIFFNEKQLQSAVGVIENFSLLGLSIVTSQEQFDIHKVCFTTFMLCASLYQVLTLILFQYCGFNVRASPFGFNGTKDELRSLSFKEIILKANLIIIPLMMFFYWYHNAHCTPYAYSMFCLTEYLVVLLNMGFHMCAYLDFKGISVEIPAIVSLTSERRGTYEQLKLIEKESV